MSSTKQNFAKYFITDCKDCKYYDCDYDCANCDNFDYDEHVCGCYQETILQNCTCPHYKEPDSL